MSDPRRLAHLIPHRTSDDADARIAEARQLLHDAVDAYDLDPSADNVDAYRAALRTLRMRKVVYGRD